MPDGHEYHELKNLYYFDSNGILKNVVWKEGKYYVAQCLNVDVSSFGKTKKRLWRI